MPRAGLTVARLVHEASALANESGLDALTLAALAERVGVRPPSLYKHVGGLADLHRLVAITARGDLGSAMGAAVVGRSGGDALARLSDAYRTWARTNPGVYVLTQGAPDADDEADLAASERAIRVVFDTLSGFDLDEDSLVDATRALRSALHGFVSLEAANGFGLPASVDRSFAVMVAGLTAALEAWPRGERSAEIDVVAM